MDVSASTPDRKHNMPPDPLDEALAPFGDFITEAEGWLDGAVVETEGQMAAVDLLTKHIKDAKKAVGAAEESAAKPHYDEWKRTKAKFAPTLTDLDRIIKGLVAAVDGFKRKLAAQREAERKAKERAAWEAMRAAEEAAKKADTTNLEAQREADAAMDAARAAQAEARSVETVKGLRLTWFHEVTDTGALLRWINANDRSALDAFAEEYALKHRTDGIARDGMRAWQERVAA